MGGMHWTVAPSLFTGKGSNSCEGAHDMGSVNLNVDFPMVLLFTYKFTYCTIITAVKWGSL